MNKEQKRFRILNKTSKTVTVKVGKEPITVTWDEFNQNFNIVDKFWAVFNEEMQAKQEKIEDKLGFATVAALEMRAAQSKNDAAKELAAAYRLGSYMEEIQKLSGMTGLQVMQLIQQRLMIMNPFMINPMFSDDQLKAAGMYKGRRDRRHTPLETDDNGNRKVVTIEQGDTDKPTIGDAFPGLASLKDKMEKEGKVMDEDH